MIGITLTSEQIRAAPPEVRRWIERQVMASFSQQQIQAPEDNKPQAAHLAICSEEEAKATLSQIQGVLPAVNVFFELGREGAIFGQPNIGAFRLNDIAHHTRLAAASQVVACLELINHAFSNACGDETAKFCGFDHDGHCFIPLQTQQNILRLWQKVIASQQFALDGDEQPEFGTTIRRRCAWRRTGRHTAAARFRQQG